MDPQGGCFSLAELGIALGLIMTATGSVAGILFTALLKNQAAQIVFLQRLASRSVQVSGEATEVTKEAVKKARPIARRAP